MHRNDRLMICLIALIQLMTWWYVMQLFRLVEGMAK